MNAPNSLTVNGRDYAWPKEPVVVICCDGSEPDYMEQALASGLMPNLKHMVSDGAMTTGDCVFTQLHQSEQPVDRHWSAARGPRDRWKLFP